MRRFRKNIYRRGSSFALVRAEKISSTRAPPQRQQAVVCARRRRQSRSLFTTCLPCLSPPYLSDFPRELSAFKLQIARVFQPVRGRWCWFFFFLLGTSPRGLFCMAAGCRELEGIKTDLRNQGFVFIAVVQEDLCGRRCAARGKSARVCIAVIKV